MATAMTSDGVRTPMQARRAVDAAKVQITDSGKSMNEISPPAMIASARGRGSDNAITAEASVANR